MHEARERSKQKASDIKDNASHRVDEMRSKAEDTAQSAADATAEARTQADDLNNETTSRIRGRRTTGL
jgi:hypothetical protein